MIVTPFRASHLEGVAEIPQARELERHPSKTVWDTHGHVVACYGCVLASPGRAVLWLIPTPRVALHRIGVVRWLLYDVRQVIHNYGLWRVEMVIDPTLAGARDLVWYLGFKKEAVMQGYGPDGSLREQWVWVREKERDNVR